ncbi:DNA-binding transcriptional regulator, LysR family [Amycolatopsis pretoriensis]|uniref:DNA-binding transcriptional regulator, LysR family n=1 Tax=Amycolatopsis pretoriensis TaxID=218821 RepID=A0A1H5QC12_9PSEU|nr:LysR substrate-binding domain-containing protein [Amycolatopsis pretoriensis]SEF23673.1 DNA-binding transcriptional regulator, LysR family [Amycolatopsis pretoriensis]
MDLRALRYFVAVADERHVGRAANRLHMTQPPLSRAIRQLEDELGAALFERTPKGVTLTPAGAALYSDADALLKQADRIRGRVTAAAGAASLTVGTLADAAEHVGTRLVPLFRERHPHVDVRVHEAGLGDPTAGLRTGLVDVALTRTPFDTTGIGTHVLRSVPVGVVVRDDDPLARRPSVPARDLTGRRWVRLPDGTDPLWTAYWTGGAPGDGAPVLRTVQECLQAVLWNGTAALAPVDQPLPAGLVVVPLADRPPSDLVVAWPKTARGPLVRGFVQVAASGYRE